MIPAKRVKLMRCGFPAHRYVVLLKPPFPEIGDPITDEADGSEWLVLSIEDTEAVILKTKPKKAGPHA